MARDVHPDIKRALGASELHASKADRLLDEVAGKPREKQPSLADIKVELGKLRDDWEEDSKVIRDRLTKSDPPALSVAGPFGWHLSARGRVAGWVALLCAVVALAWIAGRVTAHHKAPTTEAPK